MQISIEPRQGDGNADDTAANRVRAQCVSGEVFDAPGGGPWGSPWSFAYCPAGSAVCGAQIRIEGSQGSGDDTAMNGLNLACCAY